MSVLVVEYEEIMQEKNILYIDACVRDRNSRTRFMAEKYLDKLQKSSVNVIEKIYLDGKKLSVLDGETMAWRDRCIAEKDFSDEYFEYAVKVVAADVLVIAAPYWDLSFPAMLKLFFEHICINDLTFAYLPEGRVQKLAGLEKVVYITTAGGFIGENNFGFEYIRGLFKNIFLVDKFEFYSAEGLDLADTDVEKVLADAQSKFVL